MKSLKAALAVTAIACLSSAAVAQEAEQPRTTWRIQMVNITDEAGVRWENYMMETIMPAHADAGLPVPQLHWAVMSDHEYVVITAMPGGMGTFDHHQPASRMALNAALEARLGSEEAVATMWEEMNTYVEDVDTVFTHTHP
jgi:hypothetical protein